MKSLDKNAAWAAPIPDELVRKFRNNELYECSSLDFGNIHITTCIDWCYKNCIGRYAYFGGNYCFELEEDRDNFRFWFVIKL